MNRKIDPRKVVTKAQIEARRKARQAAKEAPKEATKDQELMQVKARLKRLEEYMLVVCRVMEDLVDHSPRMGPKPVTLEGLTYGVWVQAWDSDLHRFVYGMVISNFPERDPQHGYCVKIQWDEPTWGEGFWNKVELGKERVTYRVESSHTAVDENLEALDLEQSRIRQQRIQEVRRKMLEVIAEDTQESVAEVNSPAFLQYILENPGSDS